MADNGFDLSGFVSPELQHLGLRRQLAESMLSKAGDSSPVVGGPWAALARALTPLAGAFALRNVNKQYGDLTQGATPELSALAQSNNPLALAAASKNPLIQALLPQLAQMQISQGFHARGAGADEAATGQAKLGYQPQLTGQNAKAELEQKLNYEPQIAGQTAMASVPAAVAQEKALLPLKERLIQLGQGAEFANLKERKREFDQGGGGMFGGGGGTDLFAPTAPAASGVPQAATDYLRKNPQFRDQFDQKYGAGAAAKVLGR